MSVAHCLHTEIMVKGVLQLIRGQHEAQKHTCHTAGVHALIC